MNGATNRFEAPELLSLGRPPALAAKPFETLKSEALSSLLSQFSEAGLSFDVSMIESDYGVRLTRNSAWRDMLRRQQIDDLGAQTYLGSATGTFLDLRADDYGVLRRSIPQGRTPAGSRPASVPPAWTFDATADLWREDDESLRTQGRLAWEALSVAGPAGAYVFHARAAHPMVKTAAVYGPETGIVEPGEVLLVVQSYHESGVPTIEVIDSVADRLDAFLLTYSTGASRTRAVRDEQGIRPIGTCMIVKAPRPVIYYVSARIFVRPGPDAETVRQTAQARLKALLEKRKTVGTEIPRSAIIAAVHVADASGLPIVEEVELLWPKEDVMPAHDEIAVVSTVSIEAVVR